MSSGDEQKCEQCGARLKYRPGSTCITCEYCGYDQAIVSIQDVIGEQDYEQALRTSRQAKETYDVATETCSSCAATTIIAAHLKTSECPYCGASMIRSQDSKRRFKPQSLLPFAVDQKTARQKYLGWIRGLWFAPSDIRKHSLLDSALQGVYVPFWTYDTFSDTLYSGQRGEYYYVQETYRATNSQGEAVTKTRQVRKIRWHSASGKVANRFDDVLVPASASLPKRFLDRLEPWGLSALVAFDEDYLRGMRTECYTIDLERGFEIAKEKIQSTIRDSIRRDIGGDTQRITSFSVHYSEITFKYVLLPVWISTYRYRGRVYRFLINARTGEVQGERPWSWIKLATAAVLVLLCGALLVYFFGR